MTSQIKFCNTFAIAMIATVSLFILSSWEFKQTVPFTEDLQNTVDTIPKKEKKIRDLDEALDELNSVQLQLNMEKIQKELAEAMSKIDKDRIRLEVEKALKEVDMDKIKKEAETSLARVDWDKIKAEIEKVKEVDFKKLDVDMKKLEDELKKIGPEIEKSMEKAKVEIEKAKVEIREYKDFTDGLEKDGLLNKKENYTIVHKDGELIVNDKKVSDAVYKKYKSFLDKHKKININKSDADFNINKS
ncbi:MAG TPA: hypothetical protein VI548_12140 [Chitinophagaceae bacterium]|nr:hypothetical protein [Chitinophagaceae bacterium]